MRSQRSSGDDDPPREILGVDLCKYSTLFIFDFVSFFGSGSACFSGLNVNSFFSLHFIWHLMVISGDGVHCVGCVGR